MIEMVIYGVSFDLVGKQPIVLLKTADGNKFLPIWIGHPEAAATLMKDRLSPRDAHVVRIAVTELRENTFYARITVQQDGSEIEIDSRPSDAIALAVRADAPIFAAEDVIEESAIEFEGEEVNEDEVQEIVSEFKQFLEHVTPDEFAEAGGEGDWLWRSCPRLVGARKRSPANAPRAGSPGPGGEEDCLWRPASRLVRSRIASRTSLRPSAESGPRF